MLEWYRPGGTFEDLIGDVGRLSPLPCLTKPPTDTASLRSLRTLERFVGCELTPSAALPSFDRRRRARNRRAEDDTWDDAFSRAWVSKVSLNSEAKA